MVKFAPPKKKRVQGGKKRTSGRVYHSTCSRPFLVETLNVLSHFAARFFLPPPFSVPFCAPLDFAIGREREQRTRGPMCPAFTQQITTPQREQTHAKEGASRNMRLTIDNGLRYRGVQPVSIDSQHGGTCRATDPTTQCVGMKVPLVLSHGIGDMLLCSLGRERVAFENRRGGFRCHAQNGPVSAPHTQPCFPGGGGAGGKSNFPTSARDCSLHEKKPCLGFPAAGFQLGFFHLWGKLPVISLQIKRMVCLRSVFLWYAAFIPRGWRIKPTCLTTV